MRVNFGAYLSACRQPGLSDTPNDPGIVLTIYHFGVNYTILKQKKTRLWKRVKSQGNKQKTTKTTKSISLVTAKLQHPQHIT
jgi:hypothetical protein